MNNTPDDSSNRHPPSWIKNRATMRCHGEPIGRTDALKEMIEYMKGREGVSFAIGMQ